MQGGPHPNQLQSGRDERKAEHLLTQDHSRSCALLYLCSHSRLAGGHEDVPRLRAKSNEFFHQQGAVQGAHPLPDEWMDPSLDGSTDKWKMQRRLLLQEVTCKQEWFSPKAEGSILHFTLSDGVLAFSINSVERNSR